MYVFILVTWYIHITRATYVISVYGDVYQDREFFTRTYPWIIDNIGGEVTVDYYLQGSGRYTVPQMCALGELKMNSFLQAQYLKCEAEGNQSETCLCATGVDPARYKHCVLTKGSLASLSSSRYSQLGIDTHPVIEIGYKNTIFGVNDSWYLKKICTIFGDHPPRGCLKSFACNGTDSYPDRDSVVQFECKKTSPTDVRISVTCCKESPVTYTTEENEHTYTSPYTTTVTTLSS